MDPEIWELLDAGESGDEVAAILRLGQADRVPSEVRVVAQFGEIVTVRMERGAIPNVREAAECSSMKSAGAPLGPDIDLEASEAGEVATPDSPRDERRPRALEATGRGVVVGVIDWGFDFAHPDFRDEHGETRILALWDQRGGASPDSPQPYGYGREHSSEEINRALESSDPYSTLGYHPSDADAGCGAHGTHVASIAAGNGGSDGPVGIAPEAKLVFVHLATWGGKRGAKLGDSVTLLEAIDFINRIAGERPWVINLSMGRHGEQHDGTTLVEQGLDAALRAAPGRAICQSTGNYFHRRIHASGQLRPGERRTLIWQVAEADVTPNELEIWYSWRDTFEIEVRSRDGSASARARVGERVTLASNGREVGRLYHRVREPNTLDNHVALFLYKGAPAGDWEVTLCGADVVDGRYHAWIERDSACRNCQSSFRIEDADASSTTGTICNGMRTIAVGAYNAHDPDEPLGVFSSAGPTRDGRIKPDLCAPGVAVLAARSAPRKPTGNTPLLARMSGTSMAAPHVTGTVALMFQIAPRRLRIEETHNLLLASTRKISTENIERVGSGYLQIEAAIEAARQIGGIGVASQPITTEKESVMNIQEAETTHALCAECAARHAARTLEDPYAGHVVAGSSNGSNFEASQIHIGAADDETGIWFPPPSFQEDAAPERVANTPVLVSHLHIRTTCSDSAALVRDTDPTVMTPTTMNPGFIGQDDEIVVDKTLQAALSDLIVTKYRGLLTRQSITGKLASKDDRVRVALVDLTGDKLCRPGYAGWGSTVSTSGASTAKIGIFYAAAQLVFDVRQLAKAKNITTTADLLRETGESLKNLRCKPDLRWLFEFDESTSPITAKASRTLSQGMLDVVEERRSTPNASELIMRLGFDYLASVLWQSGLRHPSRGGLWIGSSYCTGRTKAPHNPRCHTFRDCPNLPGRFAWNDDPLGVRGIVLTALSAATFFTLLAQGRLVAKAQSDAIEAFLARGCSWFHGALPGATVRAAKCGLTGSLLHDAGLIEKGGRRYAVAYLTQNANATLGAQSDQLLTQLIKDLDQLITDNNP